MICKINSEKDCDKIHRGHCKNCIDEIITDLTDKFTKLTSVKHLIRYNDKLEYLVNELFGEILTLNVMAEYYKKT